MRRIVHLFPKSPFLLFVVSLFEEVRPGQNSFLVLSDSTGIDPRSVGAASVEAIGTGPEGQERVRELLSETGLLIAHSMNTFSAEMFATAPSHVVRVWSGWGGDYYGNARDASAGLLGMRSRLLTMKSRDWRQWAESVYATRWLNELYSTAAASAQYFSAPVPTDQPVFARRFPSFRGEYHQLHYASVENAYSLPPDRVRGDDILVGNSATPENNHLEVFAILRSVGVGSRRVIAPLSYGAPRYARDVEAAGRRSFGEQFVALREFMPLDEYSALLARCGTVIMGHRRQQGLGNIVRAVWQGAHVYLDNRNPISQYLRELGISVETLQSLRSRGLPEESRTDSEWLADRVVAQSVWGRAVALSSVRSLVERTRV